jgi:hypothetical protein
MKKQALLKHAKWVIPVMVVLVLAFLYRYELADFIREKSGYELPEDPRPAGMSDLEWCTKNYSEEIAELSSKYQVPYDYLMALIVLECRGDKPAGQRFEKGVFRSLKRVKDAGHRKFESIAQEDLTNCDEQCLTDLATSWGPFQLMGYKSVQMGIELSMLRDEETAAEVGVSWIKNTYGKYLVKKQWKDAFHVHNTGERFPLSGRSKTHDPYYVSDGLKYMKHFAKNLPNGAWMQP